MTSPSNSLVFSVADTKHDLAWCAHIRTIVFVIGQNCPPEIEIDEHENICRHILGRDCGRPCATARWRVYKQGVAKIERVAVLDAWRGKRIGQSLMEAVIADIKATMPDCKTLRLGAQDYAIPFYERLGFAVDGDGFMEAGIPHHWMQKAA
ncbi:MAG: GNAT family N-acetyltransferase [Alphaproteobacteria bacterium]|nr:GNAT family N-acetyltransferase [Alphaproteobacteria bacterium]